MAQTAMVVDSVADVRFGFAGILDRTGVNSNLTAVEDGGIELGIAR